MIYKLFHQKTGKTMLVSEEDFNMVKNKKSCYIDTQIWNITTPKKMTVDEKIKLAKKRRNDHEKKEKLEKNNLSDEIKELIKEV